MNLKKLFSPFQTLLPVTQKIQRNVKECLDLPLVKGDLVNWMKEPVGRKPNCP